MVSIVHLRSGDEVQSGVSMVVVVLRDEFTDPTPCGDEIGEASIGVSGPVLRCTKESFDMGVIGLSRSK